MSPRPSPLLGYNTNVRHKGKVYHIQTEDSGVDKPHVITHVFADGGRIIASKKTDYSAHVAADNLAALVKARMQEQHKAMLIALRDGMYDEPAAAATAPLVPKPAAALDRDALDRAAEAKLAGSIALRTRHRKRSRKPEPSLAHGTQADDVVVTKRKR